MLRLHDTATGAPAELTARDPGRIGLYVCGSTVYGPPHIGHGRFSLVYDVLRRYLEYRGLVVEHVSNVTDVDDKIIRLANAENTSWRAVAERYEAQWWQEMDALGALRPLATPRATEYIAEMVELVAELVAREHAYETSDGVYLSVADVADYGLLAHQSLESLRTGAGERDIVGEEKRSPLDFALWKKAKPDEPSWPSAFGAGRPGWHTECVVMSLALLGDGFDLHGGGQDLMFPHHENERAQAEALGRPFAAHWMHNGLVTVGGQKMSKSLGNFTTLAELLERHDARAYRLLVISSSYSGPLEVTDQALASAAGGLERIDALSRRFGDALALAPTPEAVALESSFVEKMDNDLDASGATGLLFDALRRANALDDAGSRAEAGALGATVLRLFSVLGLASVDDGEIPVEVAELVRRREQARSGRDFSLADALRDELGSRGWVVEDGPAGPLVHR